MSFFTFMTANTSSGPGRPLWLLKPLPIPAHSVQPRADTLAGMCLNIISANFDAFRPGDLRLPPPIFQRLMAIVNQDRHYSEKTTSKERPDEATLWSFVAVHDPEGAAKWSPTHTLALPAANTVRNLATSTTRTEDADHPLVELPRIFKSLNPDGYSLLTTLTLDHSVDDAGLQNLRWADHLTVLWIRDGVISDDGLRMLSASLELPDDFEDGRGCWRLRALYLPGCRRVGDRSMRALARWPGLSVVDVRDTSCTEAALQVVNRTNAEVFEGQPSFPRCTDGLKGLFQRTYDPEEVLRKLTATLLKPDLPSPEEVKEDRRQREDEVVEDEEERRHLSLHVIPGPTPAPEYLHDALRPAWSSELTASHRGHFVAGGTGAVWGRNAALVNDHSDERKRHAVQWALNFESHEETVQRAHAAGKRAPKSWWEKEAEEAKKMRKEFWNGVKNAHGHKAMTETNHVAGRVYYPKKREAEVVDTEVRGMPDLMMVRLVHPEWWTLSYRRAEVVQRTTIRRTAATRAELADMLVSVDAPSQSQISPQPSSQASPGASQDASPVPKKRPWIARAPPSSLPPPSQGSQAARRNPFASKPVARSSSGVHKLPPASQADPLSFVDKRAAESDEVSPPRRDPLAFVKTTPKDLLAFLPRRESKPAPKAPKPVAKPAAKAPSQSSSASKKRQAPAPAGAPPKRKLTDFFAPK